MCFEWNRKAVALACDNSNDPTDGKSQKMDDCANPGKAHVGTFQCFFLYSFHLETFFFPFSLDFVSF